MHGGGGRLPQLLRRSKCATARLVASLVAQHRARHTHTCPGAICPDASALANHTTPHSRSSSTAQHACPCLPCCVRSQVPSAQRGASALGNSVNLPLAPPRPRLSSSPLSSSHARYPSPPAQIHTHEQPRKAPLAPPSVPPRHTPRSPRAKTHLCRSAGAHGAPLSPPRGALHVMQCNEVRERMT